MAFSSIAKDFNKESIVQAVRDFEYYTKQELSLSLIHISEPTRRP